MAAKPKPKKKKEKELRSVSQEELAGMHYDPVENVYTDTKPLEERGMKVPEWAGGDTKKSNLGPLPLQGTPDDEIRDPVGVLGQEARAAHPSQKGYDPETAPKPRAIMADRFKGPEGAAVTLPADISHFAPEQRSMIYTEGAKQKLPPEYFQTPKYGVARGADGQPLPKKEVYLPSASYGATMFDPRTGDSFSGDHQWLARKSAKLQAQGLPALIPQAQYERDKAHYEKRYIDAQFDKEGMLDPERATTFADFRGRMLRKMALDKRAAEPEPELEMVTDPVTGTEYPTEAGAMPPVDPREAPLGVYPEVRITSGPWGVPTIEKLPEGEVILPEGYDDIPDAAEVNEEPAAEPVPAEPAPEPDDEGFDDDDGDEAEPTVSFFGPDRRDESAKTVFQFLYNKGLDPYGNDDANLDRLIAYLGDEKFANMTPDQAVAAMQAAIDAGEYTL